MTDTTARLALPLLAAGQAQKEIFHNEALLALDALVQPVAQTLGANEPPPSPAVGQCWIVGTAPSGDWTGNAGALASWSEGGWRFSAACEGMWVWVAGAGLWAHRSAGAWVLGPVPVSALLVGGVQVVGGRQSAIAAPAGGSVIDAEVRAATVAILGAMRAHGLIAA